MISTRGIQRINWRFLAPFALAAVCVLSYSNSFGAEFILDDSRVILTNPFIARLWPLNTSPRGVADLTFRLNHFFGGLNPSGYHAVNVAIHTAAALVLFGLLCRAAAFRRVRESLGMDPFSMALLAAALWAAHPLQTESVTYVCQRYESLAGLFTFFSLYAFIRGMGGGRAARFWFDLSIVVCALGMGVKETMAVVPPLLLVLDAGLLAECPAEAWRKRKWVHVALFMTWAFFGLFQFSYTIHNTAHGLSAPRVEAGIPPLSYLVTQFGVIVHYLRLTLLPINLCLDYGWPIAQKWHETLPQALALALLGGASVLAVVKRHPLGFLGAGFFLTLAPTSSVIPISDPAFEHRMYVPLAFVLTALVGGAGVVVIAAGRKLGRSLCRPAAVVAAVLVVVLSVATWQRNADYASSERMWKDVSKKCPANYRARLGLGQALMERGAYEDACKVLSGLKRDLDTAILSGGQAELVAARNPGTVYYPVLVQLGMAESNRGRFGEAEPLLRGAIAWNPKAADAYCSLAAVRITLGEEVEAESLLRQALAVDAGSVGANALMAGLMARSGRHVVAKQYYRAALSRAPDRAVLCADYAWLLATSPLVNVRDAGEAEVFARKAVELTGGTSHRAFDVLGAALAEAGRFDEAAEMAGKAIPILDASSSGLGSLETRAEIVSRIGLYRSGQPFRAVSAAENESGN